MASTCAVAIFDVLDALCLVRVGEPVLAHVQVVAEADGSSGHEDLGDGKGRHGIISLARCWGMYGGVRFVTTIGWI